MAIDKIKGLSQSQITSISGVPLSNIQSVNDITLSTADVTFTLDGMWIWYDPNMQSVGTNSGNNQIHAVNQINTLTNDTNVGDIFNNQIQDGHDAMGVGGVSIVDGSSHDYDGDGTNDTVGTTTKVFSFNGITTNDSFRKRASLPLLGGGYGLNSYGDDSVFNTNVDDDGAGSDTVGNHGVDTYGILSTKYAKGNALNQPSTIVDANYSLKTTGFTVELWWRATSFPDYSSQNARSGNLWSYYQNHGVRTRFSTSGTRSFLLVGDLQDRELEDPRDPGYPHSNVTTPNYSINTWYHDVTTISPPDSSTGKHTINLYKNGVHVGIRTNLTFTPSTTNPFARDYCQIGASTDNTEHFKGYMGPIRFYHKPLSSSQVTTNYNAEKSRFGY
jgi:hypothetical protein